MNKILNTHFPNLWRHAPPWLTPPSGPPRSPWHWCGQGACCHSTRQRPPFGHQLLYRTTWPATNRTLTLGFRRPANAEQTTSQTSRLHLMLPLIIYQYLARSRARQSNYRTTRKQISSCFPVFVVVVVYLFTVRLPRNLARKRENVTFGQSQCSPIN